MAAEMILTNGRIYTMDATGTVVDTIVVREGRVAFAGRRGEATRPEIRVSDLASEHDAAALVASTAATMASGNWITGRGWDQTRLSGA